VARTIKQPAKLVISHGRWGWERKKCLLDIEEGNYASSGESLEAFKAWLDRCFQNGPSNDVGKKMLLKVYNKIESYRG
jgi:hypothetical protein